MNREEKLCMYLLCLSMSLLVFGIIISHLNVDFFNNQLLREDGAIEYMEVIIFFAISWVSFMRFLALNSKKSLSGACHLFFSVLFFFGAGEEISWGQRIFFKQHLPQFFIENNVYTQFNLHGLNLFGISFSKMIFSDLLTFTLASHLVLLPIFYRFVPKLRHIINKINLPVPTIFQTLSYLIIFFSVMLFIGPGSNDESELIEITGAIVYFSIFLWPKNINEMINA